MIVKRTTFLYTAILEQITTQDQLGRSMIFNRIFLKNFPPNVNKNSCFHSIKYKKYWLLFYINAELIATNETKSRQIKNIVFFIDLNQYGISIPATSILNKDFKESNNHLILKYGATLKQSNNGLYSGLKYRLSRLIDTFKKTHFIHQWLIRQTNILYLYFKREEIPVPLAIYRAAMRCWVRL